MEAAYYVVQNFIAVSLLRGLHGGTMFPSKYYCKKLHGFPKLHELWVVCQKLLFESVRPKEIELN